MEREQARSAMKMSCQNVLKGEGSFSSSLFILRKHKQDSRVS